MRIRIGDDVGSTAECQCSGVHCTQRGVVGFYGRATPLGRRMSEQVDSLILQMLTRMGYRRASDPLSLVYAPTDAGGLAFERTYCIATAALGCSTRSTVLSHHEMGSRHGEC